MINVEAKLPDLLKGEYKPTNNQERLLIARVCTLKKLYPSATRMYADAFAADPKLAEVPKSWSRYNAACCAALAVAGKGAEKVDDRERQRWRKQALVWLKADLALLRAQADNGKAADRAEVRQRMRRWKEDVNLAGLRGKEAIAKLPEAEREGWQSLWADVAALLKKAQAKPK